MHTPWFVAIFSNTPGCTVTMGVASVGVYKPSESLALFDAYECVMVVEPRQAVKKTDIHADSAMAKFFVVNT